MSFSLLGARARSIARSACFTASALVAAWLVLVDSLIEKDHFHGCRSMPCTTVYWTSRYFKPILFALAV
jgi:hypothetical protein